MDSTDTEIAILNANKVSLTNHNTQVTKFTRTTNVQKQETKTQKKYQKHKIQ